MAMRYLLEWRIIMSGGTLSQLYKPMVDFVVDGKAMGKTHGFCEILRIASAVSLRKSWRNPFEGKGETSRMF